MQVYILYSIALQLYNCTQTTVEPPGATDHSGCRVQNSLHFISDRLWSPDEDDVTVVYPVSPSLTGEGCDLYRLISLMFRPSACQLSAVAPFRLLMLRSGRAYQMMSPPLRPCQPSSAI